MEIMETEERKRLRRYMWYTRTSLRVIGLWPSGNSGILNSCYFVLVAVTFISQSFQMVAKCWIEYTDFETAAQSLGPMMSLLTSFAKMCIYRYHRSRLGRLIDAVNDCMKRGPADVLENLENYVTVAGPACVSLLAASWLLIFIFLTSPFLAPANEKILPFPSWYPFDYSNSTIFYSIAYCHEVYISVLGNCGLTVEITFLWSTLHSCSCFRAISQRLAKLSIRQQERPSGRSGGSRIEDDDTFFGKVDVQLSSVMELHHRVLSHLTDINLAYTYLVSILFFAALIAICCAGLQITSSSAGFDLTAGLFMVLAVYYAQQLLFYYLPGEMVAQEGMAVSFAAYDSGWESLRMRHQKIILVMILRSQLPPKLRVGQLSPLRLENYSAFLTTTASYFTSLRAVAGTP